MGVGQLCTLSSSGRVATGKRALNRGFELLEVELLVGVDPCETEKRVGPGLVQLSGPLEAENRIVPGALCLLPAPLLGQRASLDAIQLRLAVEESGAG